MRFLLGCLRVCFGISTVEVPFLLRQDALVATVLRLN